MTYILGIQKKDFNFSALLCDLMVTIADQGGVVIDRNNSSLKTGFLFKGCLFGVAGNASLAKRFIVGFKKFVDKSKSIEYNWDLFCKYSKSEFVDHSEEPFKVLLSCRVSGTPQLYLYDSIPKKISKIDDEIFSIGSGKKILDSIVELRRKIIDENILKILSAQKIPILYYPYFYCLWLSELTMGFEASKLQEIGVGGLFHFCFQTKMKEARQQPSVFIMSLPDVKKKAIYNYIYRITFVDMCLVVDNPLNNPSRYIIMPFEMSLPDTISQNELHQFGENINLQADLQQYYYFCGFGFPLPQMRGSFTCHLSSDKNKLVVDNKGNIHPDFKKIIERNIDSILRAKGPPLSTIKGQ